MTIRPPEDLPDSAEKLAHRAEGVLQKVKDAGHSVATAESCTGGVLAALLTDIPGLSSTFDRGFVTYSEESKSDLLGVEPMLIARHGVVSREVAEAMAKGAFERSKANLAISITGYAGPGAGSDQPGLVHLALARAEGPMIHRECDFGEAPRDRVRQLTVNAALEMLEQALD
jgi:nicotinamide-nucleotide amidase